MYYECLWIISAFLVSYSSQDYFNDLNIPEEHIPYFFYSFPSLAEKCLKDKSCKYQGLLKAKKKCWGYEDGCKEEESYPRPVCPQDFQWVSKKDQEKSFYKQADFGYILQQRREMKILCEPKYKEDSSLECSQHLRFCRGRNIMFNFTRLSERKEPVRYDMDVLGPGDVAGHCRLDKVGLKQEADQVSPLQSWAPELRFFTKLKEPVSQQNCDITIDKPTFIMKIDATVNMYHHFCDFFNLYAGQHVNSSHEWFLSTDVHILIWETYNYHSNFGSMWSVFSRHPVWTLNQFVGHTVCFRNVVLPLLPRMIFGLYYNTPLTAGCEKSGLFRAFSEHVLHRLKIPRSPPDREDSPVRVTFLSRNTTFRNVLNEDSLLAPLRANSNFSVNKVVFDRKVAFSKQVEIVSSSDVLVGMHGAGLTHLLFLPDWAVIFELYNCEDENCYKDLARLRGVKYITWTNMSLLHQQDKGHHPDGGAHAKFTNYKFSVGEFVRKVKEAADHVRAHRPARLNGLLRDEL